MAEAVHNKDTRRYLEAVNWIMAQQGRSVIDKMMALQKLNELPNCHVMIPSLRRFLGGRNEPLRHKRLSGERGR